MTSVKEEKARWRRVLRARLSQLSEEHRAEESSALVQRLGAWAFSQPREVLLATLPLPQEPDLTDFLRSWIDQGRVVALARTGPDQTLEFRIVPDLNGPWDRHPLGMREPGRDHPVWTGGPALCLVPGLGFEALSGGGCRRLGRGGGYYDRWLAGQDSSVFRLGVGFTVQAAGPLPFEPHDQLLDGWVNATGFEGWVRTAS